MKLLNNFHYHAITTCGRTDAQVAIDGKNTIPCRSEKYSAILHVLDSMSNVYSEIYWNLINKRP
jgi:hypothetical protein